MPTGDKILNIYNKMLIGQQKLDAHFLTFLKDLITETTSAAFFQSGVLDADQVGITSVLDDTFSLDVSDAYRMLDSEGHIIDLSNIPSILYENYPFENLLDQLYYVGIRYQSVFTGIEPNPRTGEAEYPYVEDTIGELGNPDSVTDNTTYIRLVVNTILESGVDHSGRPVRVYLDNPVSIIETEVYYDGVVAYSSPNNYVDIPYTVSQGPLGQHAPFTISTNPAAYRVHVKGVSWFKNTDLRTEDNYIFIGIITGKGTGTTPDTFNLLDQRSVFLTSLDRAYRASSDDTPASGRIIIVDKHAVELRQSSTSVFERDPYNAALLIDKSGETLEHGMSYVTRTNGRTNSAYAYSSLKDMHEALGNIILPNEPVNAISDWVLEFTRVGVNLLDPSVVDMVSNCLVYLHNTDNNQEGLYQVWGILSSTTMRIRHVSGATVSLTLEENMIANLLLHDFYVKSGCFFDDDYVVEDSLKSTFPYARDGFRIQMMGAPIDDNVWLSLSAKDANQVDYDWFKMFPGRAVLYGGGIRDTQTGVKFHTLPMFQVEKRDIGNLAGTDWANQAEHDWGYDYHCGSYDQHLSTNTPKTHLMASYRHPMWLYEDATVKLDVEEPFTQYDSATITLTTVHADGATFIPGESSSDPAISPGPNWVLAQLNYDTPNDADGYYWIYNVDSSNQRCELRTVGGGTPSLPAGTGIIRFYGGCFFGTIPSNIINTNVQSWAATITATTATMGGLRINQPYGRAQLLLANEDETNLFAYGGKVYCRAISTLQDNPDLIANDSIKTTDFSGTNATIQNYLLPSTAYNLYFNSDYTNISQIKRTGGGYWTFDTVISKDKGHSTKLADGTPCWGAASIGNYLQDYGGVGERGTWIIGFTPPHGSTLNSVSIYCDPAVGSGSTNSLSLSVYRHQYGATSSVYLGAASAIYASSSGLHTLTYPITYGNPVNNRLYEYKVVIENSSSVSNDYVYGVKANISVESIGNNWLDIA